MHGQSNNGNWWIYSWKQVSCFLLLCIVLLNTYDHYKVIVSVRLVSSVTIKEQRE